MDIVHESECLRGMRGDGFTGARVMEKRKKQNIEDQFWNLNWAFAQKTFRVDENLNIVEFGTALNYADKIKRIKDTLTTYINFKE